MEWQTDHQLEGSTGQLLNRRVVVTGGSSGIGLATARAVVRAGASVVIVGRSAERIAQARGVLATHLARHDDSRRGPGDSGPADAGPGGAAGGGEAVEARVEGFPVDVADEGAVRAFFERVGAFDHLVLSTGVTAAGPFLELDTGAAREHFEGKFWGYYYAARHGAPRLRPGGSITLISGIAAVKAIAGFAAIGAADAAVEALCRTLALELAPLRVNAVSPGLIDTPAHQAMPDAARKAMYESVAASLPVGRVGTPDDVAAAVLYVLGNGFTTAAVVHVDGGDRLITPR